METSGRIEVEFVTPALTFLRLSGPCSQYLFARAVIIAMCQLAQRPAPASGKAECPQMNGEHQRPRRYDAGPRLEWQLQGRPWLFAIVPANSGSKGGAPVMSAGDPAS